VKVDLCWAPSHEEALLHAHAQWRFNTLPVDQIEGLRQPEAFDHASRQLPVEAIAEHVFVSHRLQAHVDHLMAVSQLGVDSIDLHHVGAKQEGFIEAFGAEVLPALRTGSSRAS
jgi:hypothetical protein